MIATAMPRFLSDFGSYLPFLITFSLGRESQSCFRTNMKPSEKTDRHGLLPTSPSGLRNMDRSGCLSESCSVVDDDERID